MSIREAYVGFEDEGNITATHGDFERKNALHSNHIDNLTEIRKSEDYLITKEYILNGVENDDERPNFAELDPAIVEITWWDIKSDNDEIPIEVEDRSGEIIRESKSSVDNALGASAVKSTIPSAATSDHWMKLARCRGLDPELFFPSAASGAGSAREICARCPVSEECLEYSIAKKIDAGIWGGLGEGQRRRLIRQRRRQERNKRA